MTTVSVSVRREQAPDDTTEWLLGAARRATRRAVEHTLDPSQGIPGAQFLGHLGSAARAALGQQVITALRSLLRTDVADLLIEGWRKHRTLTAAAEASLTEPDGEQLVTLAEHRVQSAHEASLDIVLDQVPVLTLSARWEVIFDIGKVVAVVRDGRLRALHAGDATVTGALTLQGEEITRRSVHVPLRAVLDLGPGIELVAAKS